jgi:hypothetical protein
MTLSFDKNADVLYVTFEVTPPGSYIFVENEDGDVLKVDRSSRRIVGCTILSFAARTKAGKKIVIPEIGSVPFNDLVDELLHV